MRKSAFTTGKTTRLDDPRGSSTRVLLIECTETMVAQFGINGVSVRQIAKASQSSNSSVVAYHFGTKQALLRAVIEHRLPVIEQRRSELLAEAKVSSSAPSIRDLINILYRPFYEQRNADGLRSYAAFVDELSRANLIDIRTSLNADYPVTSQILTEVQGQTKAGAGDHFSQRIFLSSALIFASIRQIDQMKMGDNESDSLFADAMVAALSVIEASTPETELIPRARDEEIQNEKLD